MEQNQQNYVLELVLITLKEGTEKSLFCQAASALSEALKAQVPGFKKRSLMHTADESQWTDMVYWSDMKSAMAALGQLKALPEFRSFAAMIDTREITMRHLIPALDTKEEIR
ncbi:hypothetical protein ABEW34_24935 [Paenibacillus algorifonticola]|uniref:hypothetical protein n=1 Tax=Paenibacillus algorifonticola TaxID=684063 RepID=UPI003D2B27F9